MSPPHDRATSSGCGATNTWVTVGEYTDATRGQSEPALANQGHEDDGAVRPLVPSDAVSDADEQLLLAPRSNWNDHAAAVGQLLSKRIRDRGSSGRDDD